MSLYGINFTFGQSQLLTLAKLNYKAYEFSLKGMSKVPWKVSIRALSLQLAAVILICFVQESVLFGKQEVLSGVYSPASVSVCTQLFRQNKGTRGFHPHETRSRALFQDPDCMPLEVDDIWNCLTLIGRYVGQNRPGSDSGVHRERENGKKA